jgi:hypothetical protein
MAKVNKNHVRHEKMPKKTSSAQKRSKCKMSSMNKHKKRSHKFNVGQGRP